MRKSIEIHYFPLSLKLFSFLKPAFPGIAKWSITYRGTGLALKHYGKHVTILSLTFPTVSWLMMRNRSKSRWKVFLVDFLLRIRELGSKIAIGYKNLLLTTKQRDLPRQSEFIMRSINIIAILKILLYHLAILLPSTEEIRCISN